MEHVFHSEIKGEKRKIQKKKKLDTWNVSYIVSGNAEISVYSPLLIKKSGICLAIRTISWVYAFSHCNIKIRNLWTSNYYY